jgi:hypothetical protein
MLASEIYPSSLLGLVFVVALRLGRCYFVASENPWPKFGVSLARNLAAT